MKILPNNLRVHHEQGFNVYRLSTSEIEIAVVPQLGAKIISLKNARTGRQWIWHPTGALNLFRNRPGDDFSRSPLVGVDECLPTIAPCSWQGRSLPDHGEVWYAEWNVDEDAWQKGLLKTAVHLEISPFNFERTLELDGDTVRLTYRLSNRSAAPEQFLWAMHPLLRLEEGDRLALPASTRALLKGADWVDAVDTAVPEGNCSKLVVGPLTEGFSAIHNSKTGERFELEWNTAENNALGLWLTRGGWHGHHHFAVEPTNAGADALTTAAGQNWCSMVPGSGGATWSVNLRIR